MCLQVNSLSLNNAHIFTVCTGADQLGARSREGSPGVRGRQVSDSQAKATTQGLCTRDICPVRIPKYSRTRKESCQEGDYSLDLDNTEKGGRGCDRM